jgi:hypothetical protein
MGAGMWRELVGTWVYATGTEGTCSLPEGAVILAIRAEGGGTVVIFGGATFTFAGEFARDFNHSLCQSQGVASQDIVFTGTTSYYVEYLKAPGT